MATYNNIKKIKIRDNTFAFHILTALEIGAAANNHTYIASLATHTITDNGHTHTLS